MRRLVLSLFLVVAVVGVGSDRASASCLPLDPRAALNDLDAAFVGVLVEAPDLSGESPPGNEDFWVFEVTEWVKGDLGGVVEVLAPVFTSVDFGFDVGEEVGVLVEMRGEVPTSNGCLTTDPEILLAAANPLPAPDGDSDVAVLVGGGFGDVRLIALDSKGGTLAYGPGEGTVRQISVCPGSQLVVEVAGDLFGPPVIAVRDLLTMTVVREVPAAELAPSLDEVWGATTTCLDESAAEVMVMITGGEPFMSVITSLDDKLEVNLTGVWSDWQASLGSTHAVVLPYIDASPTQVISIEYENGNETVLFDRGESEADEMIGDIQSVALSPDQTKVAILDRSYGDDREVQELIVVGVDGSDRTVVEVAAPDEPGSRALWADDSTIVVATAAYEGMTVPVFLYDVANLDLETEWSGWTATPETVSNGVLYGFEGQDLGGATLVAAPLTTGPQQELKTIPSEGFISLAPLTEPLQIGLTTNPNQPVTPDTAPQTTSEATPDLDAAPPPETHPAETSFTLWLIATVIGVLAITLIGIRIRNRSRDN